MLPSARAADPPPSGEITVLMAASLADLFKHAQAEFTAKHPDVHVLLQPGGSLALIRQILDLNKEADVLAVADRSNIPDYLMPKHADWSVDFLTEQIVLIAADDAKYAKEITAGNWYEILLRPGVEYGISDPDTAPVGYRSLMVWQLAESHYQQPKLYDRLRANLPKKNIRSNAVALLALLKSGEIDYIFDYASLAKQHGLRAIPLPKEINLSEPLLADRYAAAVVTIPGKEPGTTNRIKGAPIVYSLTIPKHARNRKAAEAFVSFLTGPRGRALMANAGMTPLVPARVVGGGLPPSLQSTLLQR
ncbi:MAG: extracellular solute-binding protein [Nitrospirota bacterium]